MRGYNSGLTVEMGRQGHDRHSESYCMLFTYINIFTEFWLFRQEVYKNNSDMDLEVIRLTGSRQGWELKD